MSRMFWMLFSGTSASENKIAPCPASSFCRPPRVRQVLKSWVPGFSPGGEPANGRLKSRSRRSVSRETFSGKSMVLTPPRAFATTPASEVLMPNRFDVVVIGGGHAGCEAAAAAARMGAKTALVTHRFATIGAMSCNPAIGGLGKGHLVREIDALDGLMGRVADAGGIQFRVLNRRKGPAVRGPRAQADRKLYAAAMRAAIRAQANLTVVEGEADDLIVSNGRVTRIMLGEGRQFAAGAVVITTGTFLRGLIHLGEKNWPAGRVGEAPAMGLSSSFERAGFAL